MSHLTHTSPVKLSPELLVVVTEWELSRRSLIVEAALTSIDHILHAHRQEELAIVERDVSRGIHEGYLRRREEARNATTTTPSPTRLEDDNEINDDESPKTARGPAPAAVALDQSSIPTLTFKWNLPVHNSRVKETILPTDPAATTRANRQECYRDHTSPPGITSPRRSRPPFTISSSPNRHLHHLDANTTTSVREVSRGVSQVAAALDESTTSQPTNQSFDQQPISWGSPTPSTSAAVVAPVGGGSSSSMRWAGGSSSRGAAGVVAVDSLVEEVFTTSWAGTPSRSAGPAVPLTSALEDKELSSKKIASPPSSHSRRRTGPVRCESPNVRMLRALKEQLASSVVNHLPEQHQHIIEDEQPTGVEHMIEEEAVPTPSRQLNPSIIYNAASPQSHAESILQMVAGLDDSCDSVMYPQSDTSCNEAVQRSFQAASVPRRGRLFEGITYSVPSPSQNHTFRDPNSDDRTLLHNNTTSTESTPTPTSSTSRSTPVAVATTVRSSPFRGLPMGRRDSTQEDTASLNPRRRSVQQDNSSQPVSKVSTSEPTTPPPTHASPPPPPPPTKVTVASRSTTTSPDLPSNPPTAPTAATVTSLYDYETLRDISVQLEEMGGGSSTEGGGAAGEYSRSNSKVDGTSTFEDEEDDDDFAAADAALEAMRSVLASGREAISSANSPQRVVASSRIVRGDMSAGKRSHAFGRTVAPHSIPVRDSEYDIEEEATIPPAAVSLPPTSTSSTRTSISVALRQEIAAALASQPAPLVPKARTTDAQFVPRLQTPPVVAPLSTATLKMPAPAPSPIDSSPPRHTIITREVPPNPSRPPVSTPPPSPPSNLPVVFNRSIDEVYEASTSPTPTPTLVPTTAPPPRRAHIANIKQETTHALLEVDDNKRGDGDKKGSEKGASTTNTENQEIIDRDEEEGEYSTEGGVEQPRSPTIALQPHYHQTVNPNVNAKGYSSMFMATPALPNAAAHSDYQPTATQQHIPSLVSSCASSVAGVESAAEEEDNYHPNEEALESEANTPRSATVERAISNANTRSQSVPPEVNEDAFSHRAVSLPPDVAQAVEEDKEYYDYYVVDDSSVDGTAYPSQVASHRGSSIPVADEADIFDADLDASLSGSGPRSRRRTKTNAGASDDSRSANSSPVKQLITHTHPAAVVATPPPTVCDVLDFDSPIPTAQNMTAANSPSTVSSQFLANLSTEAEDIAKASSSSPSGRYRHRRAKVNKK